VRDPERPQRRNHAAVIDFRKPLRWSAELGLIDL
jgi:hypothetical protein